MAVTSKNASNDPGSMSSVLSLDQHPKRKFMILAAGALLVIALIVFAADLINSGHSCNAALPTERYGCLQALAGNSGNVLYCDQIGSTSYRSSCIMAVAEGSGNVSSCSAFHMGQSKDECVDYISATKKNPLLCDSLDGYNQSVCKYGVALGLNFSATSYCSGIPNATYSGMCTAQSYYHNALLTHNSTYCSNLPSGTDTPLEQAMNLQDPSSLSGDFGILASVTNTTPQDICYASLASYTSSGSCSHILNSTLRQACNESSSSPSAQSNVTFQNATADCASGTTTAMKDLCYFTVYTNEALQTANESWCGMISNKSYMNSCIVNLASQTSNITYCNALQNSNSVQSCIEETQLASNYT